MSAPIYRATRMPGGRQLDRVAWIFDCPLCEYVWAYDAREAAVTGATTHCRVSGGKPHDALLVDILAATSPLFDGRVA